MWLEPFELTTSEPRHPFRGLGYRASARRSSSGPKLEWEVEIYCPDWDGPGTKSRSS